MNDKQKRVLFIIYDYPPIGGGAGRAAAALAGSLSRQNYIIHILTSDMRGIPELEPANNIHIDRIGCFRRYSYGKVYISYAIFTVMAFFKSFLLLNRYKFSFVHAFFTYPSGVAAYFLKKVLKTPYLLRLGGADIPGAHKGKFQKIYTRGAFLRKKIWHEAKHIVLNSPGGMRAIKLIGESFDRISVIPNGIDTSLFKPGGGTRKEEILRLIAVAPLVPHRGIDTLLRAFQRLIQSSQFNAELMVIGEGPGRKKIQQLISYLKITDNVKLCGYLSQKEMSELYRRGTVFILPNFSDAMPNALLEASASGLPIVVLDKSGQSEIIQPERNAVTVSPGNVIELRNTLADLLSAPDRLKEMGEESRKISEQFRWKSITTRYLKLYRTLVR